MVSELTSFWCDSVSDAPSGIASQTLQLSVTIQEVKGAALGARASNAGWTFVRWGFCCLCCLIELDPTAYLASIQHKQQKPGLLIRYKTAAKLYIHDVLSGQQHLLLCLHD